jgi:uncharacterized membrane protein
MEFLTLSPLLWLILIAALLAGSWFFSLVDAAKWKRIVAFGCRCLGILFLVLALCRPFASGSSSEMHVIFLVDVSQSVDLSASVKASEEIGTMIDALASGDTFSIYAVGSRSREFETAEALKQWINEWMESGADDSFRSESRLADLMIESRMAFPAGKMKRLVLFSDGQNTRGNLDDSLRQLAEENVSVHFQKTESMSRPEAAVVAIKPSSPRAFYGEVVRMTVELTGNQDIDGKLRMIHKGVAVQEQPVKIQVGQPNRFYFDVDMSTPGDSKWTAELLAVEDHFPINNQRTCTVSVRGKPRVLVLHENIREMRSFERAMARQDVMIEVRGKFGLPDTIQGLTAFDAIVLSDFPATSMNQRQMNLLNRYVKDFGGGLAMLGSENSFGLGGYHRTPVEDVLPLVSRFEKEKEKPSLAMVLVMDKSGSMEGVPIALARQAAKAAVELLGPRDQIGVVGFDDSPYVVSELRGAIEVDAINAEIDSLAAGGGTNMYPAMVVGKEMLQNANAKIRHMICLSDGHTQAADHDSLTQAMVDSGITVSTVALGDADRQLLANIAEIGRGRYYETNDPANVPQIFTKETMQASKSAIKEDLYGSVQTGDHRALAGFQETELPFSLGFVMTQQKPTAQVLLVTETGDPLLAVSRFGLGNGLAYTSDLTDRWGGEWLAWGDFGKFWGQLFRAIARNNDGEGVVVSQQINDDRWELAVTRTDSSGEPQSKVEWELATLNDQGVTELYPVSETGLGRYFASIPIGKSESLSVRLRDPDSDKTKVLHYDRPYPSEYALSRSQNASLNVLPAIDAGSLRDDLLPISIRRPIAHWFYLAAIAFLLCGNLMRRV